LSALRTGRLYPQGIIPGTHFCWRLSQPQVHSAAGRVMSMKNSSDNIENRTRDLPVCSAVPQPTAPPRAAFTMVLYIFQKGRQLNPKIPHKHTLVQCSIEFNSPVSSRQYQNNLQLCREKKKKIEILNLFLRNITTCCKCYFIYLWFISEGAKSFQKPSSHLKILGATTVT
jgi:hypothetical protein